MHGFFQVVIRDDLFFSLLAHNAEARTIKKKFIFYYKLLFKLTFSYFQLKKGEKYDLSVFYEFQIFNCKKVEKSFSEVCRQSFRYLINLWMKIEAWLSPGKY